MFSLVAFIPRAILQGMPLLFGCTGETISEKVGSLNLGIPGVMYVGAICGVIGSFLYEQSCGGHVVPIVAILIPFLACLAGALIMGLLFAFLTVTLRANQNVVGLAMTTFGIGFGNFFGGSLMKLTGSAVPSIALSATSKCFRRALPFADDCGAFGKIFLSYGFMTYLAVAIAIVTAFILTRTRIGLQLRAIGENPATADAAGIDYANGVWSNDAFGDRGWLAIALVIFTLWKPNIAIFGSILFGGLYILNLFIPGAGMATKELYKMLPYLVTIIVLIITSMRRKREHQPPEALGLPYFREDR